MNIPQIILWEGLFVGTYYSNYYKDEEAKNANQYNDPKASFYRHNDHRN
ncbi:hypothetical protein [Candidatus Harpocratesius sp.]